MTRTENTIRNSMVGLTMKLINLLLTFIVRTMFINLLGKEYLGINGLFTNILTILSFAELGIGNAIVYSMYKPLAQQDFGKVNALVKFYHKCYCFIGIFILIIGSILNPFIEFFITGYTLDYNIHFLFTLYLLNSAVSYFFSSRTSFLSAAQQQYKVDIYQQGTKICKEIIMGVVLFITHNFILYLVANIILELALSAIIYFYIGRKNRFLLDKTESKLSKEEYSQIGKNVSALLLYKIATTVLGGTDNIIISAFVGLEAVGILSNYTLVVSNVQNFTGIISTSITASVGDLNTEDNPEKQETIFNSLLLGCFWVFGILTIGMILFFNPVFEVWIGEEYTFDWPIVFAIALNFYVGGMQTAGYTLRITKGYFRQSRFFPVLNAVLNIVLSVSLVKPLGVFGVLIATPITRLLTTTIVDPYYVYKLGFKKSPWIFYRNYIKFAVILTLTFLVNYIVLGLIPNLNILVIFLKAILCFCICNIIFYVFLHKEKEFSYIKNSVVCIIKKWLHK